MADWQTFLSPTALATLEGLELRARRVVEGFLAGKHRSPRRGFSTEFAEHREYAPGDDLRYLDWKVFARSDRFYLKLHEEETNLACYLVLDTSESMRFQSDGAALSKWQAAQVLTASLAYLILHQQDAAGLATANTEVRDFVPAAGYPSQWRVIIETLNRRQPEGETRLGSCLQTVAERVRKRSLVIVISDLFDDPDRLALGLRHLHSRRHDVSVLQVVDPQEQDFAIEQVTRFKGLEGETEVTANPLAIRRAYRDEFNQFVKRIRRECHERSIDFELVRTDQPLDRALAAFLRGRKERLSWG